MVCNPENSKMSVEEFWEYCKEHDDNLKSGSRVSLPQEEERKYPVGNTFLTIGIVLVAIAGMAYLVIKFIQFCQSYFN